MLEKEENMQTHIFNVGFVYLILIKEKIMELTIRQKELLEELLWKEHKELQSLIFHGGNSVDTKYCANSLKVVTNILEKLQ
jgi:hypothetical protein